MSEWRTASWGEIASLKYGKALRGYQHACGPVRVFGTNGPVGWTNEAQTQGPGVIIGRKGAYRGVHYSPDPFWVIDTAYYLNPKIRMDLRWAYYALSNLDINSMDSGSAIPSTSRPDFYALPIRVPSLAEQRAISDVLGAIDDKIAVNNRICVTYEAILKLRFEKLGIDAVNEALGATAASQLIEFNPKTMTISSEGAVYLEMSAVSTDSARIREWSRREPRSGARFMNNDTVMARITPCLENGKVAFVDFMDNGEVGVGSTEFIVMRAKDGIPVHFPYFLARSARFREHAIRGMVGSSGRQRVSAAQLGDFQLRRPDHNALMSFGAEASVAFSYMKSLGAESKTLTDLRDTLLPRLISGEIRVRKAERILEGAT